MKTFDVWVKGRMLETKTRITAPLKADAMLTLALQLGVKSFQCDAVVVKPTPHWMTPQSKIRTQFEGDEA